MWANDHKLFDELESKCGNRYLAVKYISKLSRKLSYTLPAGVLGSDLITWALTGKHPDVKFDLESFYKVNPDLAILEDYLQYVSDDSVKTSIRKSYQNSIRQHHLVYFYETNLDEGQQARVRILLRMIWSEYLSEKYIKEGKQ